MRVAVTVRFGKKEEVSWRFHSMESFIHMGALGWAQQNGKEKESWAGLRRNRKRRRRRKRKRKRKK